MASYGGSNLRYMDKQFESREMNAEIALLLSNNSHAPILDYARRRRIPSGHLSASTHADPAALDEALCLSLISHNIDLVFLSGFLKKVGPTTVHRYRGRILNVHPALLPAHGGKGMYGDSVYAAVLAGREGVTGATVHLVDEEYDHGPTVLQRTLHVEPTDTVESLRERCRELERELCLASIGGILAGSISLPPPAQ